MNRQVSNGWIIGVATAFASSGVRITRVFAAAGLIHSTSVALGAVESVAKVNSNSNPKHHPEPDSDPAHLT